MSAPILSGLLSLLAPDSCAICSAPLAAPAPRAAPARGAPLCGPCAAAIAAYDGDRCPRCGRALVSERGDCMDCRGRPRAFDEAFALLPYAGAGAELLSAWKFGGRRRLAAWIAAAAAERLAERWPRHVLVPVPPRLSRRRAAGYDRLEDLVAALGRRGFAAERLLERRGGAEQKLLDLAGREANARSSYRLARGTVSRARPLPERCLLVDDVITSGATLDACASLLKSAGVREVAAFALAAD